ncbi:MAG: MliC family protein [Rhizobiales bacterium]|nr:MliC family protein [Hyphomicrobiales bacterium]
MTYRTALGRAAAQAAVGLAMLAGAGPLLAAETENPISAVTFDCKDDKNIEATFYPDKVSLVLSDGRTMDLPQTMSGSGIRYANEDETFVFWSKGDTAFVTEGADEKETFSDCVVAK